MRTIVAAIHGILTGQTDASWPDKFDAWMFQRDPAVKVLKKEYRAGPFPRWNCWVKDPFLARSLANELELFLNSQPSRCARRAARRATTNPQLSLWLVAHSNGAVIALLTARLLINRGIKIGGLILTGAACEADIDLNQVLEWHCRGMLGAAIAYSSTEDEVLPDSPTLDPRSSTLTRLCSWLWGKLIWPYGSLGRTGWLFDGRPLSTFDESLPSAAAAEATACQLSTIHTRWYPGGHGAYFAAQNIAGTFEQLYRDIEPARNRTPSPALEEREPTLAGNQITP